MRARRLMGVVDKRSVLAWTCAISSDASSSGDAAVFPRTYESAELAKRALDAEVKGLVSSVRCEWRREGCEWVKGVEMKGSGIYTLTVSMIYDAQPMLLAAAR